MLRSMFYGAVPILFQVVKELRNNQTDADNTYGNF